MSARRKASGGGQAVPEEMDGTAGTAVAGSTAHGKAPRKTAIQKLKVRLDMGSSPGGHHAAR
jgi:hypothetical protein